MVTATLFLLQITFIYYKDLALKSLFKTGSRDQGQNFGILKSRGDYRFLVSQEHRLGQQQKKHAMALLGHRDVVEPLLTICVENLTWSAFFVTQYLAGVGASRSSLKVILLWSDRWSHVLTSHQLIKLTKLLKHIYIYRVNIILIKVLAHLSTKVGWEPLFQMVRL